MTLPNENSPDFSPTKAGRVHKTFLFTDIVQSTDIRAAVIREFGDTGNQRFDNEVLAPHDEVLNRLIAEFSGVVVSTAGDSYFIAFDSAQSAVLCAVTIQSELIRQRIPLPISESELPPYLQIRIGLHTGGARELLRAGRPNYSDHTINIAARIEGLAQGEQVLMSEETWNSSGRLKGVTKHEWKGYELKGVDGVWTLIEALWDGHAPRLPRLPAQLTASSTRPAIPFILPQLDAANFTGRVEELTRLESLLIRRDGPKVCSIVGLTGGGGIGKTALACHFAAIHRNAFPDGVIGLRVDGKNNDTIAREFARLCGEEIGPDDERQAACIMQEVFSHQRMLLIFDNAEDASIQVLRPGGQNCTVIITTRDRQLPFLLGVSERECIDLSPLPPTDARHLLEQLIGEERVAAEPEGIEEIIRLTGSLPLALQIVDSMLHLQQYREIGDYTASLMVERERLEKLKVRGAAHLDVQASFSLSLRLLTDEEVDFFACQSVCSQDGFSLQAAMAAGACDEDIAYERLNYLYRLSLLNRPRLNVSRHVFHPLIRLFAQDLSVERSLQAAAVERHARYFIQLAKTSEATDHRSAVLVVEDTDDCMLAAAWLQQQQILDNEFVASLEHFLEQNSYWQQACLLITSFLSLAERQEHWPLIIRFRLKRAKYLSLLRNWTEAEQMLALASETMNRVEDHELRQRLKAYWFGVLGGVWQRKGYLDESVDAIQRGIVIYEQIGDMEGQAKLLNKLGSVLRRQGYVDKAVDVLQRSKVTFEQLGDQRSLAMALSTMGSVLQQQGQYQAAEQEFRRSYEIEMQLENHRGQAMMLNSLGSALERQGQLDDAMDARKRSIAIFEQLGDQRNLAIVLKSIGGVLQRQGQLDEAIDAFRRSKVILEQFGDQRNLAIVLNSMGCALLQQGRLDEAMDTLKRSADIGESLSDTLHVAIVLNSIGGVLQQQWQLDEAVDVLQRSIAIFEQLGERRSLANTLITMGKVLQRQKRFDEAIDAFRRSMAVSQRSNDLRSLAKEHFRISYLYFLLTDVTQREAADVT